MDSSRPVKKYQSIADLYADFKQVIQNLNLVLENESESTQACSQIIKHYQHLARLLWGLTRYYYTQCYEDKGSEDNEKNYYQFTNCYLDLIDLLKKHQYPSLVWIDLEQGISDIKIITDRQSKFKRILDNVIKDELLSKHMEVNYFYDARALDMMLFPQRFISDAKEKEGLVDEFSKNLSELEFNIENYLKLIDQENFQGNFFGRLKSEFANLLITFLEAGKICSHLYIITKESEYMSKAENYWSVISLMKTHPTRLDFTSVRQNDFSKRVHKLFWGKIKPFLFAPAHNNFELIHDADSDVFHVHYPKFLNIVHVAEVAVKILFAHPYSYFSFQTEMDKLKYNCVQLDKSCNNLLQDTTDSGLPPLEDFQHRNDNYKQAILCLNNMAKLYGQICQKSRNNSFLDRKVICENAIKYIEQYKKIPSFLDKLFFHSQYSEKLITSVDQQDYDAAVVCLLKACCKKAEWDGFQASADSKNLNNLLYLAEENNFLDFGFSYTENQRKKIFSLVDQNNGDALAVVEDRKKRLLVLILTPPSLVEGKIHYPNFLSKIAWGEKFVLDESKYLSLAMQALKKILGTEADVKKIEDAAQVYSESVKAQKALANKPILGLFSKLVSKPSDSGHKPFNNSK